jgi:hypothetical protein
VERIQKISGGFGVTVLGVSILLVALASGVSAQSVVINEFSATPSDSGLSNAADQRLAWTVVDFDDSSWSEGAGGLGYADDDDETVVNIQGSAWSLYIRRVFTASTEDSSRTDPLKLLVDYDDGFVAYLNGSEVARENLGSRGEFTPHNTRASGLHEAGTPSIFDLGFASAKLVPGENVLTLQVHNNVYASSDLSIIADLIIETVPELVLVDHGDLWRYRVGTAEPVPDPEEGALAFSDWIELRNMTGAQLSLLGWSLTDEPLDVQKWTFPDVSIEANGFLVVLASSQNLKPTDGSPLHTNFRLQKGGDYLGLFDPFGALEDQYAPFFPRQIDDLTYGRDGIARVYFETSTPGEPNAGNTFAGLVDDPEFSVERGFKDSPFSLLLTTEPSDAPIRYTLDSSSPSPTHGFVSTMPIDIDSTTIVRAMAYQADHVSSVVVTHSYIFAEDVLNQTGAGFPSTWGVEANTLVPADYEMDANVSVEANDLRGLPTLSVAMDEDDLFHPSNGLYSNPGNRGDQWHRPCSAEMILEDGTTAFQIACGLRMQGGGSRGRTTTSKHNFALLFQSQYGPSKLEYPVFPDSEVERFDRLVLRAGYNFSWNIISSGERPKAQYIRDQWVRDSQILMGHLSSHGRPVHLYLNSLYWGVYNLQERPDADFVSSHLGGVEEDWDALNGDRIVDGDFVARDAMWEIAHQGLASSSQYLAIQEYLDVVNFADYMLLNLYVSMSDWGSVKNFYYARRREPGAHFNYVVWDAERAFDGVNSNRTGVIDPGRDTITEFHSFLLENEDYRLLFADRIYKHLFNDGVLTAEAGRARYEELAELVFDAIAADSSRWGDHWGTRYTREQHWIPERDWILNTFFPQRHGHFMSHMRSPTNNHDVYPNVDPPVFSGNLGVVAPGSAAVLTHSNGPGFIYYTIDGSDPREFGTGLPVGAVYEAPIPIEGFTAIRARVRVGATWSALAVGDYSLSSLDASLRVSEVMYHPEDAPLGSPYDDEEFEFLEFTNVGTEPLDLTGVTIEGGITFDFTDSPMRTLGPAQYIAIVENPVAFATRYDTSGILIAGKYSGRLSNLTETITVKSPLDTTIVSFSYQDHWYPDTDGLGYSLNADLVAPDLSQAGAWLVSAELGGSPGTGGATQGGPQLPGDANQDGDLGIVDALTLLFLLFDPGDLTLPCAAESLGVETSLAVLDLDDSTVVDLVDSVYLLRYLYLAGPAPSTGSSCTAIVGCPGVCN